MILLDEKTAAIIKAELKKINSRLCCLLEKEFDFSNLPEYENNTAALAAGLTKGELYRLPMVDDVVKIAVVFIP